MSTPKRLTILQINDTHAYLAEHWEMFRDGAGVRHERAGGFARIKACFEQVRRECGPKAVVAFDNGDTLHGTYPAVQSEGEAVIGPLNALQLDAWTVHWDFSYGADRMKALADKINHPLLACNCYQPDSEQLLFRPTLVLERSGLRIGVIGIAAVLIDKSFPPDVSQGVTFTLGKEELPRHIQHLRGEQRVDVIIVLSHLGFPQDCQLATEIDGIDILLSGHTHNRTDRPLKINGATLIQSGCHGSFVGRLDIEVTDGTVSVVNHKLIVLDQSVVPDEALEQQINQVMAPDAAKLQQVMGRTLTDLNRYASLESTMDNLLLDAIAAAAGTEIAFSNGWRYGAPVPAGDITLNDLWNIIPVNPPVSVVELSGAELWEMMEENLERTFARNPFDQMGGYVKRCRGINVYFRVENPPGSRIQEFFVEGSPLQPDAIYQAAFVTQQGVAKKYGRNRRELDITAIEALQRYLESESPVSSEIRGTIVAI